MLMNVMIYVFRKIGFALLNEDTASHGNIMQSFVFFSFFFIFDYISIQNKLQHFFLFCISWYFWYLLLLRRDELMTNKSFNNGIMWFTNKYCTVFHLLLKITFTNLFLSLKKNGKTYKIFILNDSNKIDYLPK